MPGWVHCCLHAYACKDTHCKLRHLKMELSPSFAPKLRPSSWMLGVYGCWPPHPERGLNQGVFHFSAQGSNYYTTGQPFPSLLLKLSQQLIHWKKWMEGSALRARVTARTQGPSLLNKQAPHQLTHSMACSYPVSPTPLSWLPKGPA